MAHNWTDEERKRIGERMRLAWLGPEKRLRLLTRCGPGGKSVMRDASYRVRMSLATKGIPKSEEARQKMSVAAKGKPKSPEHAAKCRVASLGKTFGPYSPERIWSQRFSILVRNMLAFEHKWWCKHSRDRRRGGQYNQWRRAILVRDGYTCQGCGATPLRLDTHHLLSWERFPDLRYDIENGVSLCVAYHRGANVIQRQMESLLWPAYCRWPRLVRSA